jgi:subtilisin family serine protease
MNRKHLLLCLTVLTALLVAFGAYANAPRRTNQPVVEKLPYAPDRVVVQVRASSMNQSVARLQAYVASPVALGIPSLDAVSAQVGAVSVARSYPQPANAAKATQLGLDRFVTVTLAPGSDVMAAAAAYAADPGVEYASPDWRAYHAVVPTDPSYTQHWGHNNTMQLPGYDWGGTNDHTLAGVGVAGFDTNAELGWDGTAGFGSAAVIIAIIDSGVNLSHPDLTLVAGRDTGNNDATPEDDSADNGHGTACAGVAAAEANNGLGACGSAPGCSIMPIKAADSAGDMFFTAIAAGIIWAADNGADVISMSLGNPSITTEAGTDAAIAYASGVVILAATDNDNDDTISYPANNANVIAVGAASPCDGRKRSSSNSSELNSGVEVDPNGFTCDGERWWGSSYGPATQDAAGAVDVIAPTILFTTDIQGADGYEAGDYDPFFNGTSCATPYAAGVCALILSQNPGWTPAQVRARLTSTAQDIVNVESGAGWDRFSGYGLVDINAAVGPTCEQLPVAVVQSYSADADNNCCIVVRVSDIDNGSNDPDGADDIASLFITAVDGTATGDQDSVTVCGDGPHTVTLTITDTCGNTDSEDASVEVLNSPPVAVTSDFSANANDACCIVVHVADIDGGSYDPDGAGDIKSLCITDVDGTAVSCLDSVTVCGQGFHTVNLTITDWCDSTSTATANVEVIDITPPEIDVVLDRDVLWPPNHKMVEICAEITATDNCDPDPEVALVSVESDEPDNDKGDGNTTGDIDGADTGTEDECFSLRSERQGGQDGRTYTIIYSATDNSNNVAYDTVYVDVPHDQGASAFSSSGFNFDGSSLLPNTTKFAVFIPGASGFEVRRIDPANIYIGNTAGVVKAYETRQVEINNDQFTDLAVMFNAEDGMNMDAIDGMQSVTTIDDGLEAGVINDGPIGLHFSMLDGKNYLVGNVYGLGAPVPMPDVTGKKTVTPEQETLAPIETPTSKVTRLSSVSPNPFNPQTTVHFSLASATRVRIAIYDVTGSLVRRLVDESMPAGDHQARWDGRNDAGNGATSGIYFVRMIAGSYTEVRKIVMLK